MLNLELKIDLDGIIKVALIYSYLKIFMDQMANPSLLKLIMDKKGQLIIQVTQNKVADKCDNILTLYNNKEQIPQTVSLNIKAGVFEK